MNDGNVLALGRLNRLCDGSFTASSAATPNIFGAVARCAIGAVALRIPEEPLTGGVPSISGRRHRFEPECGSSTGTAMNGPGGATSPLGMSRYPNLCSLE